MPSTYVEAGQRATAETGFRSVIGLGGWHIASSCHDGYSKTRSPGPSSARQSPSAHSTTESTGRLDRVSTRPEGQRTSSRSTTRADPSPNQSLGSLEER